MIEHSKNPAPTQLPNGPKALSAIPTNVDQREQLCNEGLCGPIQTVSVPESMITRIRGVLLDVDPRQFWNAIAAAAVRNDPRQFYERVLKPMLARNSVLAKAQVRVSGTGLHAIIFFAEPIELETEGQRLRWAGIIKVIQCLLPTDPHAPGITALTRPVGSTNSKCNSTVTLLAPGIPVTADEVIELYDTVRGAPIKTVMQILFGTTKMTPCPICQGADVTLAGLDRMAMCYDCGKIKLWLIRQMRR